MSKIQAAINEIKSSTWMKVPQLPDIETYVRTGDPSALKRVTPAGQSSYWGNTLVTSLRSPSEWQDEDRRLVHLLQVAEFHAYLWQWLNGQLASEKASDDLLAPLIAELETQGVTQHDIAKRVIMYVSNLTRGDHLTSAGRYLLALSDDDLKHAIDAGASNASRFDGLGPVTAMLCQHAPQRVEMVVDHLLNPGGHAKPTAGIFLSLLNTFGDRFVPNLVSCLESSKSTWDNFNSMQPLYRFDPARFGELCLRIARVSLTDRKAHNLFGPIGEWMVTSFGKQVVPDLVSFFERRDPTSYHWGIEIIDAAAKIGSAASPILWAAVECTMSWQDDLEKDAKAYARASRIQSASRLLAAALKHLIDQRNSDDADRIETHLRNALQWGDADSAIEMLVLIGRFDAKRMEKDVWGLMQHKSKPVRSAAARALAKIGDDAIPQASELLKHKKADARSAAVTLLGTLASDKALAELESRLDDEANDDVRDQMLLSLAAAWEKQGRKITRKDVEARIEKARPKLAKPPADWVHVEQLPPLYWSDGERLSADAVSYLVYRQSRASQMRADVEAAPMYALLDHSRSGDFARAILKGFLALKQDASDRWAMALAGLVGNDGIVPELIAQIRDWVDHNRGKLAEYAVQALALLGTDTALLAVDAMAIRYRNKMKNVGRAAAEAFNEAAEKLGITPEELGDRVVPWLGFEPGKPRILDAGKTQIEVSVGLDLKLAFKDLQKNKPVKSLPKTLPRETLLEFKDLSANLREIIKAQQLRLENLLVRQRRWPASAWKSLFLQHPLLLPFAAKLVWGHYDASGKRLGTFRALPDRTLTTNQDDAYDLPDDGIVGMLHPMELTDDERSAWQNHLADYEIEPPFPQLERQVVYCNDEQKPLRAYTELNGTSINGMTFKGRAERLGWYRGSVVDGGCISSYHKTFPAAGVDVFLGVDGFYIGIDMYSEIKLQDVMFVKSGSVKTGSYTYDEPSNADDPRVIALGDVPPIVFSEVMGDLKRIAANTTSDATEA